MQGLPSIPAEGAARQLTAWRTINTAAAAADMDDNSSFSPRTLANVPTRAFASSSSVTSSLVLSPRAAGGVHYTSNQGEPLVGPGRAVRNPPGTAYHVGGAVLKKGIQYDSLGNAVLRVTSEPVVREDPQQPQQRVSPSREEAETEKTDGGDAQSSPQRPALESKVRARVLMPSPEQQREASKGEPLSTVLGSLGIVKDTDHRGSGGGGGHHSTSFHAATTTTTTSALETSEAERAFEREREAFFAEVVSTYPLLKVLPPTATLQEQQFTTGLTTAEGSLNLSSMSAGGGPPLVLSAPSPTHTLNYDGSSLSTAGLTAGNSNGDGGDGGSPGLPTTSSHSPPQTLATFVVRIGNTVDERNTLRALSWSGCRPAVLRPAAWRLLCDYAPPSLARQRLELGRKRRQYASYTRQYPGLVAVEAYVLRSSGLSGRQDSATGPRGQTGRLSAYSAIPLGGRDAKVATGGGHGAAAALSLSASSSTTATTTTSSPSRPPNSDDLSQLAPDERAILSQLALDLPRHRAAFFHCGRTVACMARCLFLWAQRHPAVGYVQGMDDLIAVFFQVFLTDALGQRLRERLPGGSEPTPSSSALLSAGTSWGEGKAHGEHEGSASANSGCDDKRGSELGGQRQARLARGLQIPPSSPECQLSQWSVEELDAALDELPEDYLVQVEGDTYWCGGRVLSLLQDNFTHGQPGIKRAGEKLHSIVAHADPSLSRYFSRTGVPLKEVCFQWLHCMLVRELPLPLSLLLWDTYLCLDGDEIPNFHVYVCAALVLAMRSLMLEDAPMDVAMTALKDPFAYLFPKSPPVPGQPEERRREAIGNDGESKGTVNGLCGKDQEWMKMLVADAYRLWRSCPF